MKIGSLIIIIVVLAGCSYEERVTKIGIQPFNDFDPALVDTISIALRKTYHANTYVLNTKKIPKEAFVNIKAPRYRADKIIAILKIHKPDSLSHIIGLTSVDISFTKTEAGKIKEPASKYEDWGIFGLGYRPGPSCIVSTFRLNNKDQTILIERLKKVAIHEVGHNMGLEHCKSETCVMKDAVESIRTVDLEDLKLCSQCKQLLNL